MKAIEVRINGGTPTVAGVVDGVVTCSVVYTGGDQIHHLHLGGLDAEARDTLNWARQNLAIGDEVVIRVIETDGQCTPAERQFQPHYDERVAEARRRHMERRQKPLDGPAAGR